jgi:hypothetical protein
MPESPGAGPSSGAALTPCAERLWQQGQRPDVWQFPRVGAQSPDSVPQRFGCAISVAVSPR